MAGATSTTLVKEGISGIISAVKKGAKMLIGPDLNDLKFGHIPLTYPADVMEASSSGHYICFNIKKYTSPFLGSAEVKAADKVHKAKVASNVAASKAAAEKLKIFGEGKTNQLAVRDGTVHTPVSINLYMPPSVKVSYGAKYADQEIGAITEAAVGAIEGFMSKGGKDFFSSGNLKETATKAVAAATQVGLKAAKSFVEVVPGMEGAGAAVSMIAGRIMAPRMELLFEGMGRRNFSFTFNFIPKSEEEAKTVEQIIFQFKYAMSSTFQIGQRIQHMPNTFDITYHYRTSQNAFLNKISTAVLKDMEVSYGGDRYVAHDQTKTTTLGRGGAPPQTSSLTLAFEELSILDKEKIKQGY